MFTSQQSMSVLEIQICTKLLTCNRQQCMLHAVKRLRPMLCTCYCRVTRLCQAASWVLVSATTVTAAPYSARHAQEVYLC